MIMMDDSDFKELLASVKEAGEIIKGKKQPSRVTHVEIPDIKQIRKKLNVTQLVFAQMIGISKRTLENWEQGKRTPEGPAVALLKVAASDPQAVYRALHT